MTVRLAMIGLMVRDMPRALAFYRALGLPIPPEDDEKRFVMHRFDSGVTIFWDTFFADRYDPSRTWPTGGYQSMVEFFLDDPAAVDARAAELAAAGYHQRMGPTQTDGPYAAMIDDPDGNVILITAG